MVDRENNFSKTFIGTCNNPYLKKRYIIICDVGQPHDRNNRPLSRDIREFNWTTCENNRMIYMALISTHLLNGSYISMISPDNIARQRALEIARHYRPSVGREWGAVCASLILSHHNNEKFKKIVKFLKYLDNTGVNYKIKRREFCEKIQAQICDYKNLRSRYRQHPLPAYEYPRFIVIPYSFPITKNTGHYVTLIVDLDYMENNQFKPFVYVYDSSHSSCKNMGIMSYELDTNTYFDFGNDIIVDKQPLNNDVNYSAHMFAINDEKTSKVQYIWKIGRPLDLRCGYYCEAAINLLLNDNNFTDYNNTVEPGYQTREFLRKILKNKKIRDKINDEIQPSFPWSSR